MGYRVVTVNPLKPFALLSFGLANVASLDDARQQIETRGRAAATMEIEANEDYQALDAKIKEMSAVLVNIMLFPRKSDAHAHEIEKIEKEIRGFEGAREEIACLIREKHNKVAKGEISRLELRWSTIEPALKLHLARQVRRMTHFKESCRLVGCNNPRRLRRGSVSRAASASIDRCTSSTSPTSASSCRAISVCRSARVSRWSI